MLGHRVAAAIADDDRSIQWLIMVMAYIEKGLKIILLYNIISHTLKDLLKLKSLTLKVT